jgi:hypothetical protein
LFAAGNRADSGFSSEVLGAIHRSNGDRFERREPSFDEQLELSLVGVAGQL